MHSPSPFQYLPPHVVRLIVNHVVGSSRLVFDGVYPDSEAFKALLQPFLWVCGNFRAVTYPLYCNYCVLAVDEPLSNGPCEPIVDQSRLGLGYSVHHLAKELCMYVEDRDIYTGAALRTLSQSDYKGCAFPLVREFTLVLESCPSDDLSEPDSHEDSSESGELNHSDQSNEPVKMDEVYQANVSAFMLWIKQMIPKVNDVSIVIDGHYDLGITFADHFSRLVTQLCRLGNCIEYNCKAIRDLPVESRLDEIRDLVHLSLGDNFECGRPSYLARQNAQTLQSLCFKSRYFHHEIDLIWNPDGGCVTYPCLHTLYLWEYKMSGCSGLPAFPGAVPFPFLRRLSLSLPALLGDDTLFRGNSATLESLVLRLHASTVSMLSQLKVFTPTSHPKLRRVILERLDNLLPEPFATYAEVVRFALSIGPGASVRGIKEVPSADELLPALSLPGGHSSIRVLSIPNTKLDIWQAISLIKSLPLLSDLQAPFPSIGPMPDGVTMDKLPEYMVSTYAPMGERFRCWRITYYTSNVENIMLLVLICPNFDYAAVTPPHRELFMAHMKDKIKADGFRQHEERLRRLLFGGWKNNFPSVDIAQARLDAALEEWFRN